MEVLIQFFTLLVLFLFAYLAAAVLYVFVYAVAGLFRKKSNYVSDNSKRIAVMIPAYKEDNVIIEVAAKALEQNYSSDKYDVIIIADSLQEKTLCALRSLPVQLIEVSFDKSTKSKALNKALSQLKVTYDIAVILDADNIMKSNFLEQISGAYTNGSSVIQGKRVAKNLNTSFAILDGISESVNNHIFRQGHRALGLSSGLIGSGMAFDFSLFKSLMREIKAVGGFDKELEFRLFQKDTKIEYLPNALVYDEKNSKSQRF